jgi:ATP-dependent helicase/nuclease subunit A
LDFEDILLFANKIIKKSEVQSHLREKYKYIMIDEYQDTNDIQYEIVMPILDELKQGNLFVVGDEKQSIYMFRDADLEVFDKTKREILNSKFVGKNLTLPHSFRMYPQLVLFTNKLFGNLFANPIKEFNEVEPSDLICTKNDDEVGQVGILLADESESVLESDLVIKKIMMLLNTDENLTFGDIAILCRKRKVFTEIESSLVKYNLPYIIMGGKGFYQRQSIYDVYNYLTFLINHNDDQSLIGVLRSPFFNISDSKLLRISLGTEKAFYEKLINYSAHDENIKNIIAVINENIQAIISMEPYLLIRKLLNESGYWSVLSTKKNCEQEIANMEKLLSLSREYSNKGFKNLYDYTISLKEFIDGYEDEGQAQVTENQNAIKLMTIHQSKGLEFKAVFIYGTNSKGQDDNVKSKSISISKEYGILTKVPIEKKYFSKYSLSPIAAFHNYKTKKKNYAELKRLFYVAVTRAVKYLYISASHNKYKPVKGTFYQLLCDGFSNKFENNSITLSANTTFMSRRDDTFAMNNKTVDLNVSIETQIECEILSAKKPEKSISFQNLKNELISSYPRHEIISATKISMYSQCPVKYELTYNIGYLPLMNLIKNQEHNYEYQLDEEEYNLKQYAQIRGKAIHKCLSENVPQEGIKEYIEKALVAEDVKEFSKLTSEIVDEITRYYSSKVYDEINSCEKYKNEYEVYCKEGDFFLYGIIDKLIYQDEKLIIIDYKTDTIEKDQIKTRAENYFIQLKFYAYVLSKIFPKANNYELRLVFIKHPDELVVNVISKEAIEIFAKQIQEAIKNIHTFSFTSNLEHCFNCQYALEGNKCVKSIQE